MKFACIYIDIKKRNQQIYGSILSEGTKQVFLRVCFQLNLKLLCRNMSEKKTFLIFFVEIFFRKTKYHLHAFEVSHRTELWVLLNHFTGHVVNIP